MKNVLILLSLILSVSINAECVKNDTIVLLGELTVKKPVTLHDSIEIMIKNDSVFMKYWLVDYTRIGFVEYVRAGNQMNRISSGFFLLKETDCKTSDVFDPDTGIVITKRIYCRQKAVLEDR